MYIINKELVCKRLPNMDTIIVGVFIDFMSKNMYNISKRIYKEKEMKIWQEK